jgi:transcriptional regulator with GAF, ATPase, and Fis domain
MRNQEMTDSFALVARELRAEADDVNATLHKAVALATDLIDGCDEAGVSIVYRKRRIDTPAATGDAARRGDALQYELGEGPCLDAIWQQDTILADDLATDERWPTWGPRAAAELGVHSFLALQLFTHADTLGALNLYSYKPDAFDKDDTVEGLALAAHVAVALAAAQQIGQLQSALTNRTTIGQAEGILMERFQLLPNQAFAVLARVSSTSNRRVADLAAELVETRRMPADRQAPAALA